MFPFPPSPDHESYYDHGDDDNSAPLPSMTGVSGALADVFSTAAFGEVVSLRSHLSSLVLSSGSALTSVINTCDPYGLTLLHLAAREGHIDVVDYLLQHGAQDMPDQSGITALHAAAGAGHVNVVKRLLQQYNEEHKKQMCNLRDKSGRTPLHWATRNDADSVAHILIAAGADVTLVDGKGEGALGWMSRYRSSYYRSTDPPPSIRSDAAPYPSPSSTVPSSTSTTAAAEEDQQNQQAYQQMLNDLAIYSQQNKQQTYAQTTITPTPTPTPAQQPTLNITKAETHSHQQSLQQSQSISQSQARPQQASQRHFHFATSTETLTEMHDQDMTPIPSTSSSTSSSSTTRLAADASADAAADVDVDATIILTTPENYNPFGSRKNPKHIIYTHDTDLDSQPAQVEPRELPPVDYR